MTHVRETIRRWTDQFIHRRRITATDHAHEMGQLHRRLLEEKSRVAQLEADGRIMSMCVGEAARLLDTRWTRSAGRRRLLAQELRKLTLRG